jgi:hypothetical protein
MQGPSPSDDSPTTLEPSAYYILTNNYTGRDQALASHPVLSMQPLSSTSAAQVWRLAPTDRPGHYRLQTLASTERQSVDVVNDRGVDSTKLAMADTGNFSGQYWRLDPWGDGTFRLSNTFTGELKHFDVYSDTKEPFLGTDDHSGQHWLLRKVRFVPE